MGEAREGEREGLVPLSAPSANPHSPAGLQADWGQDSGATRRPSPKLGGALCAELGLRMYSLKFSLCLSPQQRKLMKQPAPGHAQEAIILPALTACHACLRCLTHFSGALPRLCRPPDRGQACSGERPFQHLPASGVACLSSESWREIIPEARLWLKKKNHV